MAPWRETNREQAKGDGKHTGDEGNGRGPRGEGSLTEHQGGRATNTPNVWGNVSRKETLRHLQHAPACGHGLQRPEAAARLVSRTGTVRVEAHDAFLAQTKRCATQVWRRRDGTGCGDT
ncbi:hypothetical protein ERJ75_000906400 [Trypanosoma vivax]|nr:hypothetical protein ERJ75_000906400 [Trypanosoma vivax]